MKRPDLVARNKSPEHIEKCRISRAGYSPSPETREKIRQNMLGTKHHCQPHTEESKQKMRVATLRRNLGGANHPLWKGGPPRCIECGKQLAAYRAVRCHLHANRKIISERTYSPTEEIKDKLRQSTIRQLQAGTLKQDTSIEKKIQAGLDGLGIEYEHPYNFKDKFLCDFAIPAQGVVIECDGDYWHNRPEIIKRDSAKNGYVAKCGWKMVRLWEHDINDNLSGCIDTIRLSFRA
jgi:very-short-patch-repair endonuclease